MARIRLGALLAGMTWSLLGCVERKEPLYVILNETAHELSDLMVTAGEAGAPPGEYRHPRLGPGECFVLGTAVPELSVGVIKCAQRSFEPEFYHWPCTWNEIVIVHLTDARTARLEYYGVGGDTRVDPAIREYRTTQAAAAR